MHIKILGMGCGNCHTLEARTREALAHLEMSAEVSAVTDPFAIGGYGVMRLPALVIDERVVLSGRVPSVRDLEALLSGAPG